MNLTEQFLNEIEQCDTELKARNLIGQVYQKANTTSEGFLKAPFPLTWDVFYKLVELEKKFNLNYFASSYIALVLVKPKLSSNWAKRANLKKWSEFEDYCMEMYTHVAANVIPKWDKDVNDNFLAFLTHELLTVLNKITKPEVSSYVQKNYGRTVNSIEAIAQELGYDFDIEDKNFSTEDRVINEIEKDEKKYYQSLIFKKKDKIDKKQEDLEMKNQEIDKEKIIESEIVTKTTIEVTIETVENTTAANMDKETKEEEKTKPIIKKGPKIKNLDNAFSKDEIKRALIVTQIFGGLENDLNLSKRVFLALEKKENMKKKDNKENNLSIEEVVFE